MQALNSDSIFVLGERVNHFIFSQHGADVYLLPTSQISFEDLKQQLPETLVSVALSRFKSSQRQFEFLAVRLLLRAVCGEAAQIAYYPTGRPYLYDTPKRYISISHTNGFVAIALSGKDVGLDIELLSNRQLRLRQRFMSDEEWQQALQLLQPKVAAAIGWSAKEALYKLVDVPGTDLLEGLACEWVSEQLLRDAKHQNEVYIKMLNDLVIAVAFHSD